MYFMWRVIFRVQQRQTRIDEKGLNWVICARCSKPVIPYGKWRAVPITPKELGGRATIDNCAILCMECYSEVGQDTTQIIPYAELPYLEG